MTTIHPYLIFADKTEEAFTFYKSVFGGEFAMVMRGKDMPDHCSLDEYEKIMHIALPIGQENILMGSDAFASMGQSVTVGNNFYITVGPDSKEEADRIYNGLVAGGQVQMPMDDAPRGDYFGQLADKFGVQWMISYHQQK